MIDSGFPIPTGYSRALLPQPYGIGIGRPAEPLAHGCPGPGEQR